MLACELLVTLYCCLIHSRDQGGQCAGIVGGLVFNFLFGLIACLIFEYKGTYGAFSIAVFVTAYMAIKILVLLAGLQGEKGLAGTKDLQSGQYA